MVQVLLTQFENPKDPVLAKIYEAVAGTFFDIKPQSLNIQRQLFDIMRRTVYENVLGRLRSALGSAKPTDDDLLIDIAYMAMDVHLHNIHTVGLFGRTLVEIRSQSEKLTNFLGEALAKENRRHIHVSRLLDIVTAFSYTRSQNSEFHISLTEIVMDDTLQGYETFVRRAAIQALGNMGAKGAKVQETLIAVIEPEFPDIMRSSALWNLSRIGLQDENTDKALTRAISGGDFDYGNSYYEFDFKSTALKSMHG